MATTLIFLNINGHDTATTWAEVLRGERAQAATLAEAFAGASKASDEAVSAWYGFDPDGELRQRIDEGLPWYYRTARHQMILDEP